MDFFNIKNYIKKYLSLFPRFFIFIRTYLLKKETKRPLLLTPFNFLFSGNSAMENGVFEHIETKVIRSYTFFMQIFCECWC